MHLLRLLGSVDIADGTGGWRRAGPAKQSCVLAALALSPREPLSAAELITRVWGADAPASALNVLYGHMTRLRALLDDSGDGDVSLTRNRDDGYRLDLDPERVDLFAMRGLASRAEEHARAGDHIAAVELWRAACGMWRGMPLLGVDGDWARRTRQALRREHGCVLDGRFATELALGNHAAIVSDLYQAVGRDPTAESLVGHLMVTLYRCGRPAEALACFEEARARLRDALGTEPAPRLRDLHRRILRHDPELDYSPAAAPTVVAEPSGATADDLVPPMQLPAATSVFTGRADIVAQLLEHARQSRDAPRPGTVAVSVIDGMAGVGKTALAVHTAHALAPDFPDGQLFIDLHGFTADLPPIPSSLALARMLRTLGVAAAQIPDDAEDRAAAYRSALAGRRVLIVLDNAANEAQVRSLLPGHPEAFVLVTSRYRMSGLDDARPVSLDLLDADDAEELFRQVAERPLPHGDDQVSQVVALCGRLPLAVRITAARFRSRPHWSLVDLLDRLSAKDRLLAELGVGERSVPVAFQASYQELDSGHRRAFRLLGLAPGPDFGVHTAAALFETSLPRTEQLLETLLDAHLLYANGPDRYRFHDLLRRYARDICEAEDTAAERRAAVGRLLDVYGHAATAAADLIGPPTASPAGPVPSTPVPGFGHQATAIDWFDTERPHLTDAIDLARAANLDTHVCRIAIGLCAYLDRDGSYADIIAIAEPAAAAARATGAKSAEATLLTRIGGALRMLNRFGEASDMYQRALTIRRDDADRHGEARVRNSLGLLRLHQGRFTESIEHYREALTLTGSDTGLAAMVQTNLGVPLNHLGRAAEALRHFHTALEIYRELADEDGMATATCNIGGTLRLLGEFDDALEHHLRAKAYFDRTRAAHLLAIARNAVGCDLRELGRLAEAIEHHQRALRTFREIPDQHNTADTLIELGRTQLADGFTRLAHGCFVEAADITTRIDNPYHRARAHHGIADALTVGGDRAAARPHLEQAVTGFGECGVPEAVDLRTRLAENR